MRIVSLVPGMTEALFAVGKGAEVVGRSHRCDFPPPAARLPPVTSGGSAAHPPLSAGALVGETPEALVVDQDKLASLDPDLVIAPAGPAAHATAAAVPSAGTVLVATPRNLDEVLSSIQRVGGAVGAATEAAVLVERLQTRLARLERLLAPKPKPRLALIESAAPLLAPGLWVPELVAAAGADSVFGSPGGSGRIAEYAELAATRPAVILLAFSGSNLHESQARLREVMRHPEWLPATSHARLLAIDANAFVSRPGPRLVDGAELIAWALHRPHPAMCPETGRIAELIEAGWVDMAALRSRSEERT